MSLTLYHSPQTRSGMILWLLEEIGVPYDIKLVNVREGIGKDDPGFQKASPLGKVPAIDDEGTAINESAAIAIYLGDKYSAGKLAPRIDSPKRGDYLRWIVFCTASLDAAIVDHMTKAPVMEQARASLGRVFAVIEAVLAKQPYMTGDEITVADILIAAGLRFAKYLGALPESQVLQEYFERLTSRPSNARVQAIDEKLMAGPR